jgi:hypothetical protein
MTLITLMTLMTLITLVTLMTPSLPTTLDIHFNSSTSGFCVLSALVNITYILILANFSFMQKTGKIK